MRLLTKNTDYAIRAIVYMAQSNGGFLSSNQIASGEKIPLYFLRRILQVLIKENIVASKEGMKGGVRLSVNPRKIKLINLIRLFQGDINLLVCEFRKKMCSNRTNCVLKKKMESIERILVDGLKSITIEELIKDRR